MSSSTPDDHRLDGRVALVTGGGRGLGRAYALRLAALGADVAICDLRLDAAHAVGETLGGGSVEAELRALGARTVALEADVTDAERVREVAAATVDTLGRLDIVVCNAGGPGVAMEDSFASDVAPDAVRRALELNLLGTVNTCQAALPHLRGRGWGKIVTVSSEASLRPFKGGIGAPYVLAKAAVNAYTRSLAEEVGPDGITVNAIAPGSIDTALVRASFSDMQRPDAGAALPLRRFGTVEDCARVVGFLCSPLSDYLTGQVVVVDGGASLTDALGASGFEDLLAARR